MKMTEFLEQVLDLKLQPWQKEVLNKIEKMDDGEIVIPSHRQIGQFRGSTDIDDYKYIVICPDCCTVFDKRRIGGCPECNT